MTPTPEELNAAALDLLKLTYRIRAKKLVDGLQVSIVYVKYSDQPTLPSKQTFIVVDEVPK